MVAVAGTISTRRIVSVLTWCVRVVVLRVYETKVGKRILDLVHRLPTHRPFDWSTFRLGFGLIVVVTVVVIVVITISGSSSVVRV